jgi:dethiobiotin synthetase
VKDIFVTGTDTDIGKTVLSALLTTALGGIYWKPIQTGAMGGKARTDRQAVLEWAELSQDRALPENYVFDPPVSPHLAASWAGTSIDLASIQKPRGENGKRLVIEGAGGVLVPINKKAVMRDLIAHLDATAVIATRTTLGTINHTLLTVEALREAGCRTLGVVMIGEENIDNRQAIEHFGDVPVVGWIPPLANIDRAGLLRVFETHFDRQRFS